MSSHDPQPLTTGGQPAFNPTTDYKALFEGSPTPLLVLAPPEWTIVAANEARLRVTGTTREEQIGRRLFDVFPDDPDDPEADGVRNLSASLERVVATKLADTMAVQRYSLRAASGEYVERWWAPVNTPVLGSDGEVELIIHHVEDVTEVVQLRDDAETRDQAARKQQLVIDRLRALEAKQRDAEERYSALFNAIDQGFCTIEVAFDARDHPTDYRFLEISPSFERQTGIQNGAGRWMREIAPDQDEFWFETYGRVAKTGEPARFESFSTPLGRWWAVYSFRISGEHRVAVLFRDITDQKSAEAELRQSEARLAFLDRLGAETAPLADADAVLATTTRLLGEHLKLSVCAYADMDEDQDGFTIRGDWAAPGATSIVGHYSLADFGKLAVQKLSAGLPLVVNDNLRELAPEEAATFQNIGIAATICLPLVKQGRLTALMAIHDRTPRVWTEAEELLLREVTARSWAHVERVGMVADLRASEAQFRLMADAVPQIVWITDPTGRVVFFNKQWSDYTGATYEPTTASEVAAGFVHPEDASATMEAFDEARRTGRTFVVEHRIKSAAGGYRWFLVRGEPYRDARSGQIERWFGASVDIHDRRLAEAALRESEARLRELNETLESQVAQRTAERDRAWNNSQDLLLVVGTDGVFRAVNPAWQAILGWSAYELIGCSYLDFIHPDDHPSSEGALATATRADLPAYENRYRHKDGSYRTIAWVAAFEGELIYASGRDVTLDKERAIELTRTQEQLRQAQKMEAVGQLTGGIAHDFNNLLTGVIGSLDMMQRRIAKGETDRIERYTTTAMTAANRAAALTHRLLAFSRRQPLDPKPVNANRLVTGMEELLRRTIGEAVELGIVTAGGLWQTICDPHQLESSILNLAINARDAMPDGGTLTIETCNAHLDDAYAARERDVRPGQYVCICVTDTGTGMSSDTIEKAFEPFFTTKPIGQGTGLGLSMIYGFARQSEGYARIYSEIGEGTTFKLYLPRYYGESDDADEGAAELTDAHRSEDGEMVLVVEDEVAVRELVIDLLEELGYRSVQAADGPTGLKLLQTDVRVDLLVTDIGLPGLNGRQLADAARVSRPELKVLFMTGYAENATIANGFLEPGMQMITKPFAVEALATRIRDMIQS